MSLQPCRLQHASNQRAQRPRMSASRPPALSALITTALLRKPASAALRSVRLRLAMTRENALRRRRHRLRQGAPQPPRCQKRAVTAASPFLPPLVRKKILCARHPPNLTLGSSLRTHSFRRIPRLCVCLGTVRPHGRNPWPMHRGTKCRRNCRSICQLQQAGQSCGRYLFLCLFSLSLLCLVLSLSLSFFLSLSLSLSLVASLRFSCACAVALRCVVSASAFVLESLGVTDEDCAQENVCHDPNGRSMAETLQSLAHLCARALVLPVNGVPRGSSVAQPTLAWCLTLRNAKAVMEAACVRPGGGEVSAARLHQLSLAAYKASCFLLDAEVQLVNHESLRARNYFSRVIAVVRRAPRASLCWPHQWCVQANSKRRSQAEVQREMRSRPGHRSNLTLKVRGRPEALSQKSDTSVAGLADSCRPSRFTAE
jgi:hypothetical protein